MVDGQRRIIAVLHILLYRQSSSTIAERLRAKPDRSKHETRIDS